MVSWKRGRRDERVGLERGLGQAEQLRAAPRRACRPRRRCCSLIFLELELVDLLAVEQARVADVLDDHLAQHLADDALDVLVVDGHALQAVDLLHLAEQELLHRLLALDAQNVVRVDRAVGERVAGLDLLAVAHDQVARQRDGVERTPRRPR